MAIPSSTYFDHNAYNTDNTNWMESNFGFGFVAGTLETVGPDDAGHNGYDNWQRSWLGTFLFAAGLTAHPRG